MNGSAGLKVVILLADGEAGDRAQRVQQQVEHEAVEDRRDEHADGHGDDADDEPPAQLVEVLEQRQALFGRERHAIRLRSRDPPASRRPRPPANPAQAAPPAPQRVLRRCSSSGRAGERGTSADTVSGAAAGVSGALDERARRPAPASRGRATRPRQRSRRPQLRRRRPPRSSGRDRRLDGRLEVDARLEVGEGAVTPLSGSVNVALTSLIWSVTSSRPSSVLAVSAALRNSRTPLPSDLPIWGSRLGPKTSRAMTRTMMISAGPMLTWGSPRSGVAAAPSYEQRGRSATRPPRAPGNACKPPRGPYTPTGSDRGLLLGKPLWYSTRGVRGLPGGECGRLIV